MRCAQTCPEGYCNEHGKCTQDKCVCEPGWLGNHCDIIKVLVKEWRHSGLLRKVGNQGACGSCWTFASGHAVNDRRSITLAKKSQELSI